jgi:hypothetical protein
MGSQSCSYENTSVIFSFLFLNLGGMNDVIAPKRSSLKLKLVATTMLLKLNMSLILNNPADVAESPIRNTLIPSRPELPDDIDDSNDNENEEEGDEIDDDDLSLVPIQSEQTDYTC